MEQEEEWMTGYDIAWKERRKQNHKSV